MKTDKKYIYITMYNVDMNALEGPYVIDKAFKHNAHAIHYLNQQKGVQNCNIKWTKATLHNNGITECDGWKLVAMELHEKMIDVNGEKLKKLMNSLNAEEKRILDEYYKEKFSTEYKIDNKEQPIDLYR